MPLGEKPKQQAPRSTKRPPSRCHVAPGKPWGSGIRGPVAGLLPLPFLCLSKGLCRSTPSQSPGWGGLGWGAGQRPRRACLVPLSKVWSNPLMYHMGDRSRPITFPVFSLFFPPSPPFFFH